MHSRGDFPKHNSTCNSRQTRRKTRGPHATRKPTHTAGKSDSSHGYLEGTHTTADINPRTHTAAAARSNKASSSSSSQRCHHHRVESPSSSVLLERERFRGDAGCRDHLDLHCIARVDIALTSGDEGILDNTHCLFDGQFRLLIQSCFECDLKNAKVLLKGGA